VPLLDNTIVNQLHEFLDPEDVAQTLGLFPEQARIQADEIAAAIASGDAAAIKRAAHTMKGANANIGAQRIAAIAKAIEVCSADPAEAAMLLELVRREIEPTREALGIPTE
jgi:HPt (histidine-containing phosphotransfer) domain-containing protein